MSTALSAKSLNDTCSPSSDANPRVRGLFAMGGAPAVSGNSARTTRGCRLRPVFVAVAPSPAPLKRGDNRTHGGEVGSRSCIGTQFTNLLTRSVAAESP